MSPAKPFFIETFWGRESKLLHSRISASDCGERMQYELAATYPSPQWKFPLWTSEPSLRGLQWEYFPNLTAGARSSAAKATIQLNEAMWLTNLCYHCWVLITGGFSEVTLGLLPSKASQTRHFYHKQNSYVKLYKETNYLVLWNHFRYLVALRIKP
jgi:hypothetical protein